MKNLNWKRNPIHIGWWYSHLFDCLFVCSFVYFVCFFFFREFYFTVPVCWLIEAMPTICKVNWHRIDVISTKLVSQFSIDSIWIALKRIQRNSFEHPKIISKYSFRMPYYVSRIACQIYAKIKNKNQTMSIFPNLQIQVLLHKFVLLLCSALLQFWHLPMRVDPGQRAISK